MLLNLSDISSEPLHLQISRQIRARILAGELPAGSSLPSIRTLARENRVSVITIQRAYDDLTAEGLIQPHHGKGFFVASINDLFRKNLAQSRLSEKISSAVDQSLKEGLEIDSVRTVVEKVFNRISPQSGKNK